MDGLKIAMVGYLNTLPFEYGLKQIASKYSLKLLLDVPSKCAQYFKAKEADLALVPVGSLPDLEDYEVCLDYCIACDGPVRTVCLMSNSPIEKWDKIYLDKHSKTSRVLCQILMQKRSKESILFKNKRISEIQTLQENEAVLMIGDKVFQEEHKYSFQLDLGELWKEETGLPFVFALWIKRKGVIVDESVINNALANGMDKIPALIKAHAPSSILSEDQVDTYITKNLKYRYLPQYKIAVKAFLERVKNNNWY